MVQQAVLNRRKAGGQKMKTFKEWIEELSNETLAEASKSKIRADSLQSVSNFNTFPTADYYSLYRMGVAMASMPDEMKGNAVGPAANKPLTLGYTAEEQRMIELVGKLMGHKSVSLTGPGSKELDDTSATSPVPDRKTLRK
jgi:hypothetical protein